MLYTSNKSFKMPYLFLYIPIDKKRPTHRSRLLAFAVQNLGRCHPYWRGVLSKLSSEVIKTGLHKLTFLLSRTSMTTYIYTTELQLRQHLDGNIKAPTMYTNTVNGHFWSYLKYRTIASKVGTHLIRPFESKKNVGIQLHLKGSKKQDPYASYILNYSQIQPANLANLGFKVWPKFSKIQLQEQFLHQVAL